MKKIFTILIAAMCWWSCSYDDGDLWNSIDDLDSRIKALEEQVGKMNTDISSMRTIVNALDKGILITSVDDNGNGYDITFSDGNTITVNHGSNGTTPDVPIIGIAEEGDVYYWTLTVGDKTDWLTDKAGNRMPVTGQVNVVKPVIGVDEQGYWTVNYGTGPERILGADGEPVKAEAGESDYFSDVTIEGGNVVFTLADGTVVTLAMLKDIIVRFGAGNSEQFEWGQTRQFALVMEGVDEFSVSKPDGWRYEISETILSIIAPAGENPYAEQSGIFSIVAAGNGKTVIVKTTVRAWDEVVIVTFEDADEGFLAGPTAAGENLYSTYTGEQVYGYYDNGSDLAMMIEELFDDYDFWYGGTAVSRFNNTELNSDKNQLSVWYTDPITGRGGYNGSQTFAVCYYSEFMGYGPKIQFLDEETEWIFDSFQVMNTTYSALTMLNGGGVARPLDYENQDYMQLNIIGYDKSGNRTGQVDFYLADFTAPSAPGILDRWTRVDLSSLGLVNKLEFKMQCTDRGVYGINTPTYFCFDEIVLRR